MKYQTTLAFAAMLGLAAPAAADLLQERNMPLDLAVSIPVTRSKPARPTSTT